MKTPDPPFDEPITLPIEDSIDLHTFQPKEVASVVEEYLEECRRAGFSEVRLIHGKGIGVQRNIVRSVLSKHPAVLSHHDAPAEAGGWGSTVVVLKQQN
ncbi:MAG TPA: Smr/MutS family protein [Candidatus Deferrimicrobium sp.]|nr:Smr/MutS family protein [Candidatus Deferrimicrobium sp.]